MKHKGTDIKNHNPIIANNVVAGTAPEDFAETRKKFRTTKIVKISDGNKKAVKNTLNLKRY